MKTIYRIEGALKNQMDMPTPNVWTPLEEYGDPRSAETSLRYWRHEFPFKDLFVWRVTEQSHPPK